MAAQEFSGPTGFVLDVIDALGEVGVAVLVALESLFPPIPSELVLPVAGFLASRGELDLLLVVVAATVGSVLGAVALYELGARVGRARLRSLMERIPLLEVRDLDRAEEWFQRHGHASVLVGRCLPVVRSLVSVPAGAERMPRPTFLLLTAVGSGAWNAAFVLAGYALGARFTEVERYSSWFNGAFYVALALLVGWGVRRGLQRRRREAAGRA